MTGTMTDFKPKIAGFLCNWCSYAGADLAGVSRLQYPPMVRIIRVMCSGRIDPYIVLEAFLHGVDGVFIGGCHPERVKVVSNMFPELCCIELSKEGIPKHPLYLSGDLVPKQMRQE